MPELPEVETVRRQIAPHLVGKRIIASWARALPITVPDADTFVAETRGRRVLDARRHGKQMFFPLEGGAYLLVHLGMSGRLQVEKAGRGPVQAAASRAHVHAVLRLEGGGQIVFADPRRFGEVAVARDLSFLAGRGPDPLTEGVDEEAFAARLKAKTARVKAVLLDQRVISGLGNIYADEVCWQAGVHPARRCHTISRAALRRLASWIRPVLERAVDARGATLPDGGYQDLFGADGIYHPDAYGRTGEPCHRCGAAIRRGVLSGRSYHWCPRCQPARGAAGPGTASNSPGTR